MGAVCLRSWAALRLALVWPEGWPGHSEAGGPSLSMCSGLTWRRLGASSGSTSVNGAHDGPCILGLLRVTGDAAAKCGRGLGAHGLCAVRALVSRVPAAQLPLARPQASQPVLSMDLWPPSSAWKGGQLWGRGPGLAPRGWRRLGVLKRKGLGDESASSCQGVS